MAKTSESRLAQILREELKSGGGLVSSLAIASSESQREKYDVRNVFPKTGVLGQVLEQVLGKGYRYGGRKSASASADSGTGAVGSAVSAGAVRLTARNTMVLPAMARDMNIMKRNMQELVSIWGGKKSIKTRAETNYLRTGGRVKKPPSASTSATSPASGDTTLSKLSSGIGFVGTLAAGIVSGLFGILTSGLSFAGSVLGSAASLIGTALSGMMGIGGSVVSTIFGGLASVVSGMGIFGLVALAGAGFLVYQISKSIKGELSFDKVMDYIKESLGFKEGETFRDALMRGLGFIDEKTGLNTKGTFEKAESKFIYWLEYSKSMFAQVADTVQKFGELAIVELQSGFLTYGAGLLKILAQIYGTAIGAKAGVTGAGLASILMGSAFGPAGTAASMGLRALIAGGTFAGFTALGYKGGTAAADIVNDALAGTALNSDQKAVLEKMKNTKGFLDELNSLNYHQEQINLLKSSGFKNQEATIKSHQQYIDEIKNKPQFKAIYEEFQKAFSKDPGDIHADAIEAAKKNLDLRKQQILAGIPTPAAMRSEADQTATSRVAEYEDTVQKPTREASSGSNKLVFAKFPTAEAGFKAQRDLWERKYSNVTIADAIKKWAPDATENYGKGIERAIGKSISTTKFGDLTEEQKVALLNEQARQEGFFKPGTKPNRLNNPGAILFAETQRKFGGEPVGTPPSDRLAGTPTNRPSPEAPTPPKTQTGLNQYSQMSDTELMVAILGDMFGDIAKMFATGINSMQNQKGDKVSDSGTQGDSMNYYDSQIKLALAENLLYRRG